ncbi:M56 family metallopeptidase [Fimbriimonas ginsengisoli]|uniref:Putative glycine-rich protein n=1 Tax=Fimbriimonas ginsengisoli Gsoil 348 TaxID=661478 RepID=A0A068NTF6_FIMGI|nr:M56 family metallopeptidase [Fimbriimonas ginsengisoli]AIE86612.1 putative glycine-rich protein [Fimbriimonas ginsengisoli Gsoil 348]
MNAANAVAESWARALFAASWQGGLFILGVWALCIAFRRMPPWVKSWLWWIACTQMLLRVFLTLPIAMAVATPALPAAVATVEHAIVIESSPAPVTALVERSTPEPERPSPMLILMGLWGVGVVTGGGIAVRRLLGARRLVKRAAPLNSELALTILNELTDRPPRLLESPDVKCPLLAGYVRPVIVVPSGFADEHDAGEIRMAFAHEVAHLRRRDLWLSFAVATVQTAYFFHPLVWLASHETAIAREEACDLDVLRLCGESPSVYAHFLFKSAQGRTPVAALGAAYGYRNLRRRITMLKRTSNLSKSSLRRSWLVLIAAGAAAALPWSVVAQSSARTKTLGSTLKTATGSKSKKNHSAKTISKSKKSKPSSSAPTGLTGTAGVPLAASLVGGGVPGGMAGGISSPRLGGLQVGGGAPGGVSTAAQTGGFGGGGLTGAAGSGGFGGSVATGGRQTTTRSVRGASSRGGGLGTGSAAAGGFGGGTTKGGGPSAGGFGGISGGGGFGGGSAGGGLGGAVETVGLGGLSGGGVGGQEGPVEADGVVATPAENSGGPSLERLITADVEHGMVEKAIIQVLKASGTNFVIKAKIRPEIITCHFSQSSALTVLSSILKGSDQALTYRREGDVIYIVAKE